MFRWTRNDSGTQLNDWVASTDLIRWATEVIPRCHQLNVWCGLGDHMVQDVPSTIPTVPGPSHTPSNGTGCRTGAPTVASQIHQPPGIAKGQVAAPTPDKYLWRCFSGMVYYCCCHMTKLPIPTPESSPHFPNI